MKALVVGGTGPTGTPIVEGLLKRGYEVTIYHTGAHEQQFSRAVQHLHGDPRQMDHLVRDLKGKRFDVCVSTYGRLRYVAQVVAGNVKKLVAITGEATYDGVFVHVGQQTLPVPIPEDEKKVTDPEKDRWGYMVHTGEEALLEAHRRGDFDVSILRYPYVYGPHAASPFDWYIVKRVLDKRPHIILEADGLTHPHRGYSENLAHAAMLCIERPQASGQAYNVGDERVLSLRAICSIIADAFGHKWEMVELPLKLSPRRNPYARLHMIVFDLHKIRSELGYKDLVPAEEATRRYALWLRGHQPDAAQARSLGDRAFDYEEEDRAIGTWKQGLAAMGVSYEDYMAAKPVSIGWPGDRGRRRST